jgi:hypothetical protein
VGVVTGQPLDCLPSARALATKGRSASTLSKFLNAHAARHEEEQWQWHRGCDGKKYPARHYLPESRDWLRFTCWRWHTEEGLSVRQIQDELEASYRIRRSVGSIHADIRHGAHLNSERAS